MSSIALAWKRQKRKALQTQVNDVESMFKKFQHFVFNLEQKIETRQTRNRNLCHYFSKNNQISCAYHDSCLEQTFHCGSKGFNLDFAAPMCKSSIMLRNTNYECDTCVNHSEFANWGRQIEECVQSKLKTLADTFASETINLENDCLNYETEAFKLLEECFLETSEDVCTLMKDTMELDTLESDLHKLAKKFAKDEYYKTVVQNILTETVHHCSDKHDDLDWEKFVKLIPSSPERIVFCVSLTSGDMSVLLSEMTEMMSVDSQTLNDSLSKNSLYVADSNSTSNVRDNLCRKASSTSSNGALLSGYRHVEWTPEDMQITVNMREFYKKRLNARDVLLFFPFEITSNNCGNGLREAGETCDTFLDVGNPEYGCDFDCVPFPGYDCSLDRLQLSECHKDTM